jgi:4-hydroxybenzoate polyprenyltransferase
MKSYLSLIKFSHTIFALPFAMIGFVLAITKQENYLFDIKLLGLVLVCMVTARSAAMAFNRYIDRKFDLLNPRTAVREIPAGIITPQNALFFILGNCTIFVITTWLINSLCFALSPVTLLIILGYSYTKRFTPLCHLVLGIGLALAPIGAYLAVTGRFDWLPLMFSAIVFCWVAGFDIIYALQDEEFDKNTGLYSIPSILGKKNALLVSRILHVISAIIVVCTGYFAILGTWYWAAALIFCAALFYQHRLVKWNDLSKINLAFFTTNGIASVIFGVLVIIDRFF